MRVVWTAQAQARLTEIHAYIAKDQPLNANRFIDRVTRRGDRIGDQPWAGRIVPEYHQEDLREVLEGAYRIIYRILADRVDVVTVRHGAQRLPDESADLH
ncbi:MAG: type II toxin-antitoxin system RelE/ParE family toxin [Gammaproteobacteria bacterium]